MVDLVQDFIQELFGKCIVYDCIKLWSIADLELEGTYIDHLLYYFLVMESYLPNLIMDPVPYFVSFNGDCLAYLEEGPE